MPQSFARVSLHLVFSVKERARVFRTDEMRDATSAYITGILQHLECPVIRVATVVDHIHILYLQSRTQTIADVVAAAKRETTEWIGTQPWARGNLDFHGFHWQRGYGVFSVSESNVDSVAGYIDGQQEHHKRATFQDEYREFLRRHKIEFDERHVWD